jgi:capsular polysaccharide biosynthesis protein
MGNREIQPYEEEVDLFEYWLAIRKHWILIVFLALAATAGVLFWTYNDQKSYAVTTTISLGRIEIDGKVTPVTNIADIQQILNSGNFINHIMNSLKLDEKRFLSSLRDGIEAQAKDNTENVLVTYKTAQPQIGIKIMEKLTEQLQKTYNPRVESYRKTKETEIQQLKEKINGVATKRFQGTLDIKQLQGDLDKNTKTLEIKTNIKNNEIKGLTAQIAYNKDRIKALSTEREKILKQCTDLEIKMSLSPDEGITTQPRKPDQDTTVSGALQTNNQQQTLGLLASNYARAQTADGEIDTLQNRMLSMNVQINNAKEALNQLAMENTMANESIKLKIQRLESKQTKELEAQIREIQNDITVLEIHKGQIEGIKVIAPPDFLNVPLKSKRSMYAAGAGLAALALGVFLALCLEWKKKNEARRLRSPRES